MDDHDEIASGGGNVVSLSRYGEELHGSAGSGRSDSEKQEEDATNFSETQSSNVTDPRTPTREEVDAKLAAVEARLDSKLSRIEAKLDVMNVPTIGQIIATVASGTAAVLAIGIAIIAFGGDRFDGGVGIGNTLEEIRQDQRKVDEGQDKDRREIFQMLRGISSQIEELKENKGR